MADPELVPVFMPALIALLEHAERLAGRPLKEQETLAIRDGAVYVMTPADVAAAMEESRGYRDLDPERAWEEWQAARTRLAEGAADETPDA